MEGMLETQMKNLDSIVDKDRCQVVKMTRYYYKQVLQLEILLESEHLV
jgi:hypothetical protein